MTNPKDEHNHNGLYLRKAECKLVRESMEREMAHIKEDVRDVKKTFDKIIWVLLAGFAVNLGGSVLVKILFE
ncbi:MAG: hypothetical protein P9L99_19765 [Candidatus Lernaella stagnicola]|nr:hypothetical protein [Candidatus Lernaella stagnicola]